MAVASAGPYANHLHLAPDRKPCQYLTTQFLQAGCPSCRPTNSVKALKAGVKALKAQLGSTVNSAVSEAHDILVAMVVVVIVNDNVFVNVTCGGAPVTGVAVAPV